MVSVDSRGFNVDSEESRISRRKRLKNLMRNYKKETLKDVDFEYLSKRNAIKINLPSDVKREIIRISELDSDFFKAHNIMDYSLLLAIEQHKVP